MICSGDLRKDYKFMYMFGKELKASGNSKRQIDEILKSTKEGIRNIYKLEEEYAPEFPWKSHGEDYDRRYRKEVYEGTYSSQEIQEFIENNWQHWYNPYEDGRDCTGVWFTTRIKVFTIKGNNKTIVYHFQDMDV